MSKARPTRAEYRFFLEIPTRWLDNDVYRHVNNVPDGVGSRCGIRGAQAAKGRP